MRTLEAPTSVCLLCLEHIQLVGGVHFSLTAELVSIVPRSPSLARAKPLCSALRPHCRSACQAALRRASPSLPQCLPSLFAAHFALTTSKCAR